MRTCPETAANPLHSPCKSDTPAVPPGGAGIYGRGEREVPGWRLCRCQCPAAGGGGGGGQQHPAGAYRFNRHATARPTASRPRVLREPCSR